MEVIRFQCPACSASLTVPPQAAGLQGPCPKCAVEIVGPSPALGISAGFPLPPPPPAAKPFQPFPEASAAPVAAPIAKQAEPESIPPSIPSPPPAQAAAAITEPPPATIEPPSETAKAAITEPSKDIDEPFKDFIPPPPEKLPPAEPRPTPRTRSGTSKAAVLILSSLLIAALAFIGGYATARSFPKPQTEPQSAASKPDETPVEAPEPIPVPVRTYIPDPAPTAEEPDPIKITGPEATLRAFLEAEDWEARSSYVLFPEKVRPKMKEHSEKWDDGPIAVSEVALFEVTEAAHIFRVTVPSLPIGFPVAVSRDGNHWLVDWETFVEFHDDRFSRFARGEEGAQGIFRVTIKPTEPTGNDSLFERYILNPPLPDREQSAYIRKDSVALIHLREVFSRKAGFPDEVFDLLMEDRGPPVVLALSYEVNSEGKPFLKIDEVIAIGWGPDES